jgi:crotonobetainyl-CoA:carnitine CoA-transferase CaiB-like acyl-CoA transferase
LKKIAFILAAASLMSVAACSKQPPAAMVDTGDGVETLEEAQSEVPLADATGNQTFTDAELDQSSSDMMNQQAADEAEDNAREAEEKKEPAPLGYLNPNSQDGLYILVDDDTGCEFIQVEVGRSDGRVMSLIPRPDGKGGQRGCGKGKDFKKS